MTVDGLDDEELRSDINVTPLVDVMLVLLVIFMVVTPLLHLQMPIDLPRVRTAEEVDATAQHRVTIAADGTLRLDDAQIALADLTHAVRHVLADRAEHTIFLEADRGLPYATVVDVMDRCRAAGVDRLGVLTSRRGESGSDEAR